MVGEDKATLYKNNKLNQNIMNNFEKHWVTSTCAPESIKLIRSVKSSYLNIVTNESQTIHVCVLSNDNEVIAIGLNYDKLLISPKYSFRDAILKIAELLELSSYSTSNR